MTKTQITIPYSAADLIEVFTQPSFDFLPKGLKIIGPGPVPAQSGIPQRIAQIEPDEESYVKFRIFPYGFTKAELLAFRETFEPLIEGTSVDIAGNTHTLALFSSCVKIEDHEVECVDFCFEIDPFAE